MSAAVIVTILLLVVALLAGVSVPFAVFGAAVVLVAAGGYDVTVLAPYGYSEMGSILFIAIPLLILIGIVLEWCGGAEAIADLAARMTGRSKGGKYFGMTIASAVFGSVSGSARETLAGVGPRLLSNMEKDGYPTGISSSLISSASMMGALIPPGIGMILYAYMGGQSLLACLLAPVIPAVILLILLSVVSMVSMKRKQQADEDAGAADETVAHTEAKESVEAPEIAGASDVAEKPEAMVSEPSENEDDEEDDEDDEYSVKEVLLAIIAPVIVLGCSFSGIMSLTEAAALAAVYALIAGWFLYQVMDMEDLRDCLIRAGSKAGSILLTVFAGMILARILILENVPYAMSSTLFAISDSPAVLILFVILVLVIAGMLMDDISAILLTTPVLVPVIISIGVNPVHFAAVAAVSAGLGCVIPPFSRLWYEGAEAGKASPAEMRKPTILLIVCAWLPTLLLTTYIPQLSVFLPSLLGLM